MSKKQIARREGKKPSYLGAAVAIYRASSSKEHVLKDFWTSLTLAEQQQLDRWLLKINHELTQKPSAPIDRFIKIVTALAA